MNEKLDNKEQEWIGTPLLHQLSSIVIVFLNRTSNGDDIEEDTFGDSELDFEEIRNRLVRIYNFLTPLCPLSE